jgi:hypothetical protein
VRLNWQPISDQTWDGIRAEFMLPSLGQVRRRLSELMEDPEPVMQQLVRVFIGEGTFCPGFQFLPGGPSSDPRSRPRRSHELDSVTEPALGTA